MKLNFRKYLSIALALTTMLITFDAVPQFVKAIETTYYVSVNGNDSNSGTIDKPFATLAKASNVVSPGYTVFIRGGTYKISDSILINSSGTPSNRISYKAYPNESPVFNMSLNVNSWQNYDRQVYKGTISNSVIAVCDEKLLTKVSQISQMYEGTYYQYNNDIYMWCFGGGSPTSHKIGLIKKFSNYSEPSALIVNGSYLNFEGITITNTPGIGIYSKGNYDKFISCTLKFAILNGIHIANSIGSEVTKCNVSNTVLQNWPRGSSSWAMAVSFYSGQDCVASDNLVFRNNGEGIGTYGESSKNMSGSNRLKIVRNTVYDNTSVNIWLDHAQNTLVDSNFVYNTPDNPKSINSPSDSSASGILCAEETDFGFPGDLSGCTITNNIVYNCSSSFAFWSSRPDSGLKNFLVANNTFVSDVNHIPMIDIEDGNHYGTVFENNIVYSTCPAPYSVLINFPENSSFTFKNNCLYEEKNKKAFTTSGSSTTEYNFLDWVTTFDIGQGSMWAIPNFAGGNKFEASCFKLSSSSPCIDSGLIETKIKNDLFSGIRYQGNGYDVGASESAFKSSVLLNKAQLPANIVANSSFEAPVDGFSSTWKKEYTPNSTSTFSIDNTNFTDGKSSFKANIVNGGLSLSSVQLKQLGVIVQSGAFYILKFNAKSDTPMTISAELGLDVSPYSNLGLYKTFSTNQTWKEFRYLFQATASSSTNSRFTFLIGKNTGTIWLDDIEIIPFVQPFYSDCLFPNVVLMLDSGLETPLGQIWKTETNSLVNATISKDYTDFSEGLSSIRVNITNGGSSEPLIQLKQNGIILTAGKTYQLSFKAKADGIKNITTELGMAVSPYSNLGLYKTFSINQVWSEYTTLFTPNVNTDATSKFTFLLGKNTGNIWLDNVVITPIN